MRSRWRGSGYSHEDPDRLRRPLRRTAGGWAEVGWDEALDEAAERLAEIQRAHGRNAVAIYQGNPVVHNHGSVLFSQFLLRSLGSRSRYSATSVDQLPQMLASLLMFGHQLLLPIPDLDRTDFLLILGANPLASNGSLMTAPGVEKRLHAIRTRGGRVVVVDPRRTETAAAADQHLPIRPGADVFLLAALIHALFAEERVHVGRLADGTDGLHVLADAVKPFAPEAVAARTGLEAGAIRALARDFGAAPSAVAYGRVGVCRRRTSSPSRTASGSAATSTRDGAGSAACPSSPASGRWRPWPTRSRPRDPARCARSSRTRGTPCSPPPTGRASTAPSGPSSSWSRSTSTATRPRAMPT